ncbi:MAG TPA: hypothetical protein VK586_19035 [Streptosporangiaceae bacterium]|nr:hypothetical protein [Streptosporangiaceae bacterium]
MSWRTYTAALAISIYQEALAQVEKVTGAAYPGAVTAREHVPSPTASSSWAPGHRKP